MSVRPGLRAVAEAAGVSVSSVSNAYNRPERLSDSVRDRILKAAEELGYPGPNPAARLLRTNHVGAVGVLLTTRLSYLYSDPYCLELLRGVSEETERTRTSMVLIPQTDDAAARQAVIDAAITDGMDDNHPAVRALTARGIPLARSTESDNGPCVIIDDHGAGRLVGAHLATGGHSDVVVLLGSSDPPGQLQTTVDGATLYTYSQRRLAGIRDGLGPTAQIRVISVGGNTVEAGEQAAEWILDQTERPTAVAADSDVLAFGVLRAIRGRGLQPGRDLAVTGFDDVMRAEDEDLTTVRQPIREKGRLLARAILDPDFTEQRTVLDTVLVPRGSTRGTGSGPRREPATASNDRSQPTPDDDPEWKTGELDLESYLHRIGYEGALTPNGQTLRLLHRAHIATIPFENLDVILGRGISVELADIQTKLVYRRRGGYCYEHNLLFAAVLQRIGYRVTRVLARTGDPTVQPRPRSHLVLLVTSDDGRWLADVGFGSGLLDPLELAEASAVRQGEWTVQLMRGADNEWRLRELRNDAWETLYTFPEEPAYQVDLEMANHNTSTHPKSPFVQRPILVAKDESTVRSLIGRTFSVAGANAATREEGVDEVQFGELLRDTFRLRLPATDAASLFAAAAQEITHA